MVSEHVSDRCPRKDHAEQVRALVSDGGRNQSSVARTLDGGVLDISVSGLLKVLGDCDDIVEGVLALVQVASFVPLEAELAAAANVSLNPHAPDVVDDG